MTNDLVIEMKKRKKKPIRQENFSYLGIYIVPLFYMPFSKFNNQEFVLANYYLFLCL